MILENEKCHIEIRVDRTYTVDSDCAVLDGEILTVLQNRAVTQIRITDGSIIHHSCFDCFGCNFAF